MVDCTGDGVVFVEADANVTIDDFGDIHPPIPSHKELLYDIPGTSNLLNAPLLFVQVSSSSTPFLIHDQVILSLDK